MKKLTALLLCLVLVFALCACGKNTAEPENTAEPKESKAPEENVAGMANPCTEYDSLEEVNSIVGGNLCAPGVMGVTDKSYAVIDCGNYKIAEYRFDVNGTEYTLRCAKATEDISGVYMEGGTAFGGKAAEQQEIGDNIIIYSPDAETAADVEVSENGALFNSDNEYKCAQWFDGDMQYVLTVHDNGEMEQDTFAGIADEIMQMTLTYGA